MIGPRVNFKIHFEKNIFLNLPENAYVNVFVCDVPKSIEASSKLTRISPRLLFRLCKSSGSRLALDTENLS